MCEVWWRKRKRNRYRSNQILGQGRHVATERSWQDGGEKERWGIRSWTRTVLLSFSILQLTDDGLCKIINGKRIIIINKRVNSNPK